MTIQTITRKQFDALTDPAEKRRIALTPGIRFIDDDPPPEAKTESVFRVMENGAERFYSRAEFDAISDPREKRRIALSATVTSRPVAAKAAP